ncbi:MAG: DegT/DnrJ/EryC1/StrS family aminotransferase [Acidobacteria bacterium]|nr:DegT/DnrJ/EryC1/StrS family aminotransferase [Acidobacteriota bacterium]MCA1612186.1 DegT/DnrJ/EryC1/StrS family aminotransferase [Acidobacteriota bacterium]
MSKALSLELKVPLLDLKGQYAPIRQEIRDAMDRVCDSQYFIMGPEVAALETELARFCETRAAIGVSSGTDALLVALMALGVGPGDEVLTTPFSFFATAGVVARLGARAVFADIQPDTFNLDPEEVGSRVTSRTKAVLPVHLFGRCADTAAVARAAPGIPLIEDAAQAIGSRDGDGRSAGSVGAMGCFSFFPSKNLGAFGDGGMVVTNDDALAETLRILRVHGGKPKYYHHLVGGNFRLDALQAAILRVKLKYLPGWTEARRRNADRYRSLFASLGCEEWVRLPEDVPGHIYNQFVIQVVERDRVRQHLKDGGIETEIYYPVPLHLQTCFQNLGYREGDFPHAEAAARESLALPIYPELTEDQQTHVVTRLREFFA